MNLIATCVYAVRAEGQNDQEARCAGGRQLDRIDRLGVLAALAQLQAELDDA